VLQLMFEAVYADLVKSMDYSHDLEGSRECLDYTKIKETVTQHATCMMRQRKRPI